MELLKLRCLLILLVVYCSVLPSYAGELVISVSPKKVFAGGARCNVAAVNVCSTDVNSIGEILENQEWRILVATRFNVVQVRFESGRFEVRSPIVLHWGTGPLVDVALEITGMGQSSVVSGSTIVKAWHPARQGQFAGRLAPKSVPMVRVADVSNLNLGLRQSADRGFGLPIKPAQVLLFQGDMALTNARYPNVGYAVLEKPVSESTGDRRTFRVQGRSGAEWRNEPDLVAQAFWFHDWASQAYRVRTLKNGNMEIVGDGSPYGIKTGQRVQIENALSELDMPGEWIFDRNTQQIVAWLPGRGTPVEAAVTETLFHFEDARNVRVRDLSFEKTLGDAIVIRNSENVVLESVSIRHSGNRGVVVEGGRSCGIRNSLIEHTGEGGVVLAGGDRTNLVPAYHFVDHTTIRDFSRSSKTHRFGVELNGVGQRVSENSISDAPHSAILFQGNNHLILRNEIFDVVKETSDAGAIYTGRDFTSRGSTIEGNLLRDIQGKEGREVKGIYLDDQASGTKILANIFARVQQPVFIGGGRDNFVERNLFYDSSPGIFLDARGVGWQRAATLDPSGTLQRRLDAVPYQSPKWASSYPTLPRIRDDDLGKPKYNVARDNAFINGVPYRLHKDARDGIEVGRSIEGGEDVFESPAPLSGRTQRAHFMLRRPISSQEQPGAREER